jgi:hypothetical protein
MPFSLEIDRTARLVRVSLSGTVSDEDVLAADDELRAAQFDPDFDELIDFSDAQDAGLTSQSIRELAGRNPVFGAGSRRAIVVRSDLGYGLARMFQARRGEAAGEIQIFRSLAHAQHWLAQPPGRAVSRWEG